MCGILGLASTDRDTFANALKELSHRGPDFSKRVDFPELRLTLGHRRLSIVDLDERSHQPFFSNCSNYVLIFNGEIYNFHRLKEVLEGYGYCFRTTSDTEILLNWMIQKGTSGLADLDGMFSFGFLDRKQGVITIARDHVGEKPLYYAVDYTKRNFAFASEIKALLKLPWVDTSLNSEVVLDYLRFFYTAPPQTLYQGIYELPAGHYIHCNLNDLSLKIKRHFSIEDSFSNGSYGDYSKSAQNFYYSFLESTKSRTYSDVPVGLYLSGGIDSNLILASVKKSFPKIDISTYTISYEGSSVAESIDEGIIASEISTEYGLQNYQAKFNLSEKGLLHSLDKVINLFDQPFGNPTALVSDQLALLASKHCKVCLVGDGGDEILIGYPRYKAAILHRYLRKSPSFLSSRLQKILFDFPEYGKYAHKIRRFRQFFDARNMTTPEAILRWVTYIGNDDLSAMTGMNCDTNFYQNLAAIADKYESDPALAATLIDLNSFVPYNLMQSADRTGMAHSIELRSPFLSRKLINETLQTPTKYKISWLRNKPIALDAFRDLLPYQVKSQRVKKAFNPPVFDLLRANLPLITDLLTGKHSNICDVLNRDFLTSEIDKFAQRKLDNSTFLWGLLALETWLRRS